MHHDNRQSQIYRTLVVQDEMTEQTTVTKVALHFLGNSLLLGQAFKHAHINFQGKIVRIYDFCKNGYSVVQGDLKIPSSWVAAESCDLILIKLGAIIQSAASLSSQASLEGEKLSEIVSLKKERSKQRVIFEVIQIVKKWRDLHQSRGSLKKMSLQEAAKTIRMPKKSLDDYYYQLRLGEKYGFDFQTHLFDRIGVLRTFIKSFKGPALVEKYEKHSKDLRIMDKFDQISQMFYGGKNSHKNTTSLEMQDQMLEENFFNDAEPEEQDYPMNTFKGEFVYLLDEKDPFLMGDYNFKKKIMDGFESDQIFF